MEQFGLLNREFPLPDVALKIRVHPVHQRSIPVLVASGRGRKKSMVKWPWSSRIAIADLEHSDKTGVNSRKRLAHALGLASFVRSHLFSFDTEHRAALRDWRSRRDSRYSL